MESKPVGVKVVGSAGGINPKLFFVKPPDKFLCNICHKVLNNPITCRNCHMSCLHCITEHVSDHHECPVCKCIMTEEDFTIMDSVQSFIEDMDVNCSSEPIGRDSCTWSGKLLDLHVHLHSDCEFHLIHCKNADCNLKVPRRLYQDHIHYDCFKRPTPCKYCKATYPYDSIHSHENTCPHRPPEYLECLINVPVNWWVSLTSGFSEQAGTSDASK